ncbi:putative ribonuclease H-like domain-containing protein [Tanacetum coccineum]
MDLENTQNNSLAKLPLLKQGEYDTWRLRIESYIQLQDYALWEIIEEGNSFKPVARTTTNEDGTSTTTIPGAVTAEQKILKKNDLKARSILMMTLPSEHLLTFNKHKDAKSLFEAIEARFGGNEATKKTQKTLLKQMYETFNASSSESLDSIFNRLQKIVSQLTILGEIITPEDLNLKFLRSLPTKWGHSSTNDVNTANVHVSTGSTPVSTASTNNSTACLNQSHKDDLDEMDLKWNLALLSMKARKFYQRTGKKIIINESDISSYDKKKVECFNCHKLGHFARECRNHRSQENRNKSQDSSRRTVNVEKSSSKAIYKKGLASVEKQVVFYKKNESMLCDQIAVLKRDASFNELNINGLKKQVERLKKEKEDNPFKIDNFESACKSLDQLIGNQISDNNKKGIGYNVVPPPLTGLFSPPSIDLSNSGLDKFKQPKFEGYGVKVNKGASANVSKEVKKTSDALIIEDWVSDSDEDETVVMVQKPVLKNVKKGTSQREVRPVWTNAMRVNHHNFSNFRRDFAPTAVLTKSGIVPFSTTRQSFSRTTTPVSTASSFNTVISVNTVKGKRMTSDVGEQGIDVVKPTTYWAWRPKIKMINHVYKNTGSCISLATPGKTATGYIFGSGEDSLKLIELMDLCTKLIDKVSILENALKQSKESHADSNNVDEESQKIRRQAQVMISDAEEYLKCMSGV